MSTDKGFIKIYRDIWNHWIWRNNRPFDEFHAWVDLIMLMNHKDEKTLFDGKLVVVERGSKITSIRKLADRWGWSRNHVSGFLNTLERDGMISQNRDSKKTVIKVLKYCIYQGSNGKVPATDRATDGATEVATDGATDGAQTIHYIRTIEGTIEEIKAPGGAEQDEVGNPWDDEGWE